MLLVRDSSFIDLVSTTDPCVCMYVCMYVLSETVYYVFEGGDV